MQDAQLTRASRKPNTHTKKTRMSNYRRVNYWKCHHRGHDKIFRASRAHTHQFEGAAQNPRGPLRNAVTHEGHSYILATALSLAMKTHTEGKEEGQHSEGSR